MVNNKYSANEMNIHSICTALCGQLLSTELTSLEQDIQMNEPTDTD